MNILIITYSRDNDSIPLVTKAIEQRGGNVFRFDTDRFPTEITLDVYYTQETEQLILASESQKLDLTGVSAVWYRRLATGALIPTTIEPQIRQASIGESRATILGMIASLRAFHLDSRVNVEQAKNKQLQLQVARELGLEIPRTLTTNNPDKVQSFAQECSGGIITKMLSSFAVYDSQGREQVVFTNPVTAEDLEHLAGLRFCPMTFQENIPKALELRTTIVGQQIFTASIDSQRLPRARSDWRRQGLALLKQWQPYQLPQELETKLLNLMNYFDLNYGALDLLVTPDERYVFLEVNPVGEFFWLEQYAGLPISQAIADLLLRL
ncbi:MAG: MvdD family ATP-grasp ribosomal peptide maturase [Xenococcus sp. (in: cyanobacteria)]